MNELFDLSNKIMLITEIQIDGFEKVKREVLDITSLSFLSEIENFTPQQLIDKSIELENELTKKLFNHE